MTPERLQDIRTAALQSLVNPVKDSRGFIHADCPHCGKPAKEKKFAYNPNKGKYGSYNCFSCKEKGNGFKLAEIAGLLPEPENRGKTGKPVSEKPKKMPVKIITEKPKPRKVYRKEPDFITRHPETGAVCYGIYRFEFSDGGKVTPPAILENGKWLSGLDGYDGPKYWNGLYEARNAERVFITEGEKKARQLNGILPAGLSAVSVMGGAEGMRNPDQVKANAPFLTGKAVYILPDIDPEKDDPKKSFTGQRAALALKAELRKHGIKAHIIDPVELAGGMVGYSKFDIGDAVEMHGAALVEPLFSAILKASDETDAAFSARWMTTAADGFRLFNSRYISETLTPQQMSRDVILSGQGTGKTTFATMIADQARQRGRRFFYLAPRQTLAGQTAEKAGLENYRDVIPLNGYYNSEAAAICLESTHYIDPKHTEKAVVIIDEIEIFCRQLHGDTNKKNRIPNVRRLTQIMKNAEQVVCMGADITPGTIDALNALGMRCPTIYQNEYRKTDVTGYRCHSSNALTSLFLEEVEKSPAGESVAYAADSKSQAEAVHREACERFPDKKFLLVTQDNSASPAIRKKVNNPELLAEYKAVIYSPALFEGVDFNLVEFKKVFLNSSGQSVTHTQLVNGAFRFRQATDLFYYVNNPLKGREKDALKETAAAMVMEMNAGKLPDIKALVDEWESERAAKGKETTATQRERKALRIIKKLPETMKAAARNVTPTPTESGRDLFRKWINSQTDFMEFKHESLETENPKIPLSHCRHIKAAAELKAEHKASLADICRKFESLLKKRGVRIYNANAKPEAGLSEKLETKRAEIKDEHKIEILSASDITAKQYETLCNRQYIEPEEKAQRDRFRLVMANGGTEDLEKVAELSHDSFIRHANALADMFSPADELNAKDNASRNTAAGYAPDYSNRRLAAELRTRVNNEIGLYDRDGNGAEFAFSKYVPEGAKKKDIPDHIRAGFNKFMDSTAYFKSGKAVTFAEIIGRHLFSVSNDMRHNPVLFARSFYQRLGMKLESIGKSGQKRYILEKESRDIMTGVLNRRKGDTWQKEKRGNAKNKYKSAVSPSRECTLFQGVA